MALENKLLGNLLVQQKIISQAQLATAVEEQQRTGLKLGRILVHNGFASEEQIATVLAKQANIPFINLKQFIVHPNTARTLPENLARRFLALVLENRGEKCLVGMEDPTDLFAQDEIAKALGKGIDFAVVTKTQLLQEIDRHYRKPDETGSFAHESGQALERAAAGPAELGGSPILKDARPGRAPGEAMGAEKMRLGDLLVQQKIVSLEQIKIASEEQKRTGLKIGRVLVHNGFASEEQIAPVLAKQLNIPFINLKQFIVDANAARKLQENLARRFRALVLEDRGSSYLVGMEDPTDLFAYDAVARALKKDIDLAVVTKTQLLQEIDRFYRKTEEISGFVRELGKELGEAPVDFGELAVSPGLEDAPVVKLLQSVFEDAVQVRASDIHIEPQESGLHIRFRIDGTLHLQTQADIKIATALVLRLKLMSKMDISERRMPQDGRFDLSVRQQRVDVRISTMPTQLGESVVMRLLSQAEGVLELYKLGMPPDMLGRFRKVLARNSGMVLVTGPTGSGKTTTLYAALAETNRQEKKVITVEDPIEYRLSGINQVQVNEKIDLTFSRVLRSALRQDPDVILVGEMRDEETAMIGLRAAMTGHMVLSTLHTNDAASTPIRLMDMGAPRYLVATSLHVVLAQRLLRKICEGCAEPHQLDPQERAWLRLELGDLVDQFQYKQGRGCSNCNGTGYQGRFGVFEMLEMSTQLVEAASNQNPAEFSRLAREQMTGKTLQSHAAHNVLNGKTTVAEAMRIAAQFED
ncbi:MAG: type II/IV secretion system protein [Sulfuricellaceae bacterium]